MRTSGTVIRCVSLTASCPSPCANSSATAWRTASPTRNWRCEGPLAGSRCCPRDISFNLVSIRRAFKGAGRAPIGVGPVWPEQDARRLKLRTSERALHRLHPVALDGVAGAHVLEILERHAAFLAGTDLTHVVLEVLELRKLALVNHHVVANEPHVGAALDRAVDHAAARDLADLGHVEDLQGLRVAEPALAQRRRRHRKSVV